MRKDHTTGYKDDGLDSFGDVISNLLGLLVVLVMVMFITVGIGADATEGRPSEDQLILPFKAPRRETFRPWDQAYVVAFDTIAPIEFESIVSALMESPLKRRHRLDSAWAVYSKNLDSNDVDYYDFSYRIIWDEFRAKAIPMDEEDISKWVTTELGQANKSGNSCSFYVYPSGMRVFAMVHDGLRREKIRFRWFPEKAGKDISFSRGPETFQAIEFFLQ